MTMQDKAGWDSCDGSGGAIQDQQSWHVQDERMAVQKRTFTRWMNVFLQRRVPPIEVRDLFVDIQDGRLLMALLEELTGCGLLYRFRSSSHRIFRLNNVAKALSFLDDRHVKLLGIDASAIVDGVPSVVLSLMWNIILFFQVKEMSGGLQRRLSSSLSSLSMSSYSSSSDISPWSSDCDSYSCSTLPAKGRKAVRKPKYHGKAIKTLLQWAQRCTSKFGVQVHDFGKSWRSGLAFLALIKSVNPVLVDLRDSLSREPKENVQEAFTIAWQSLGILPLLEPEDIMCTSPDEQSIITYVSMFLRDHTDFSEDSKAHNEMAVNIPQIPNLGSFDSISLGETSAEDKEAKSLLKDMGESTEQLLWKRWSRKSPGELRPSPCRLSISSSSDVFRSRTSQSSMEQSLTGMATSQLNKLRYPSVFKPNSPSESVRSVQDIRCWMEKSATGLHQGNTNPRVDGNHFSLSSEEGMYNLSALDSDEEDAYSYILDLSRDALQSHQLPNREVPKVEEETTEEMLLNGEMSGELIRRKRSRVLNGDVAEHEERLSVLGGGLETTTEVRSQTGANTRECEVNHCGSEGESGGQDGAEGDKEADARAQSEDGKDDRVGGRKEEGRGQESTALADETAETKEDGLSEERAEGEREDKLHQREEESSDGSIVSFRENVGGETAKVEDAKCGKEDKEKGEEEEEEDSDLTAPEDALETGKTETEEMREELQFHTEVDGTGETGPTESADVQVDERHSTSARSVPSVSPRRQDAAILQSAAAGCDVSPLELQLLVALWILLYCYFILPRMNL